MKRTGSKFKQFSAGRDIVARDRSSEKSPIPRTPSPHSDLSESEDSHRAPENEDMASLRRIVEQALRLASIDRNIAAADTLSYLIQAMTEPKSGVPITFIPIVQGYTATEKSITVLKGNSFTMTLYLPAEITTYPIILLPFGSTEGITISRITLSEAPPSDRKKLQIKRYSSTPEIVVTENLFELGEPPVIRMTGDIV